MDTLVKWVSRLAKRVSPILDPLSKTREPWIIGGSGVLEWPFERDHHLRGKSVVNEPKW